MVSVCSVKYVVTVKPLAAFFCRLDIYRLQGRYRHKVVGIPGQIAYVSFITYGLIFLTTTSPLFSDTGTCFEGKDGVGRQVSFENT